MTDGCSNRASRSPVTYTTDCAVASLKNFVKFGNATFNDEECFGIDVALVEEFFSIRAKWLLVKNLFMAANRTLM